MKFLILFLLFLALSTTTTLASEHSTLISLFNAVQNPCEYVRNGQFICQDCTTLAYCVQQNGAWTTYTFGQCAQGLYCDEEAHGCIYQQECKLTSRVPRFECQNAGIYPDPYNCKHYHVCNHLNEDQRIVCPSGTAYSPATKTCSLSSDDKKCIEPQYNCVGFGQTAAWPTDNNIYYVCNVQDNGGELISYPILYRCANGSNFINGKCTIATVQTTPSKICIPGSGLLQNPSDCYSYLVCVNGQLQTLSCPTGTSFNPSTNSCVLGNC